MTKRIIKDTDTKLPTVFTNQILLAVIVHLLEQQGGTAIDLTEQQVKDAMAKSLMLNMEDNPATRENLLKVRIVDVKR